MAQEAHVADDFARSHRCRRGSRKRRNIRNSMSALGCNSPMLGRIATPAVRKETWSSDAGHDVTSPRGCSCEKHPEFCEPGSATPRAAGAPPPPSWRHPRRAQAGGPGTPARLAQRPRNGFRRGGVVSGRGGCGGSQEVQSSQRTAGSSG